MKNWEQELKEQYEAIPVPEQAKARIREGIRQARRETARTVTVLWMKRTVGTAAAAMAAITVLANAGPGPAQAMEAIPVVGAIAKVVTFRTYERQEEYQEARIQVPQIQGQGETAAANQELEAYGEALIAQYEEEVGSLAGEGHYSMDSSYDVVFENDRYLCIRIRTTVAMGGGAEFVRVFTVAKDTGETVELSQLLGGDPGRLDAVSENIKEQMRRQMAEDENVRYFLDSDMPDTDFKGLTGQESFYFSQEGELVIVFDEYQVAPGYMGAVTFTIPKEVTGDLLGA
ncbi:MAG TPA: DUF3298 domain-containing protein [Candidatus Ventrimonas merdavium]|nr:DUF3298 domain-containing protein [Candidatus Ventrimonas merdavium]